MSLYYTHYLHCAGVQRATLRQVPLIAGASELRPRLKSHEMSINGIKFSPNILPFHLATFLLTFSTILRLKGKGKIQITAFLSQVSLRMRTYHKLCANFRLGLL